MRLPVERHRPRLGTFGWVNVVRVQPTGRVAIMALLGCDATSPRFDHRCAMLTPPVAVDDAHPLFRQTERELMHLLRSERTGIVMTDVDPRMPQPPPIERPHTNCIGSADLLP
jgi:hypothetical protein